MLRYCSCCLLALTVIMLSSKSNSQPPVIPAQPPYPITASFFADRYNATEWNQTLAQFASIGGDTVVQRAPRLAVVGFKQILHDKDFQDCRGNATGSPSCIQDTKDELESLGLNVSFATYKYDEDYSDKIIVCSKYDRRYVYNGTVTYRLVIPLNLSSSDVCNLPKGSAVLAVFTLFRGIDPHRLLIQSAAMAQPQHNVYFGLPRVPTTGKHDTVSTEYMEAYYEFVRRGLLDQSYRYPVQKTDDTILRWFPSIRRSPISNNTLKGYLIGDEAVLPEILNSTALKGLGAGDYPMLDVYTKLSELVHNTSLKVMVSTKIDLTKKYGSSVNEHVMGFETLAKSKAADIVAVSEGRGYGTGCYYFPGQVNETIKSVDPMLFKILHHKHPNMKKTTTFRKQYVGSNNELFAALGGSRDDLNGAGLHFDFWLNVEAFEDIPTNKCGAVDTSGPSKPHVMSRTSKQRMDKALSVAGLFPQKVIATSWDPSFTCKPKGFNTTLFEDIHSDMTRVIVSHCGFHSRANMSVVLIGYNVGGNNNVTFYTREGARESVKAYGYYFEGDWGGEHGRVPSLIYTQLWDMYDAYDLSMNGTVIVLPDGAYNACQYQYDYRDHSAQYVKTTS